MTASVALAPATASALVANSTFPATVVEAAGTIKIAALSVINGLLADGVSAADIAAFSSVVGRTGVTLAAYALTDDSTSPSVAKALVLDGELALSSPPSMAVATAPLKG